MGFSNSKLQHLVAISIILKVLSPTDLEMLGYLSSNYKNKNHRKSFRLRLVFLVVWEELLPFRILQTEEKRYKFISPGSPPVTIEGNCVLSATHIFPSG